MEKCRLRVVRAERRVSQLKIAITAHIDPTRFWRIENDLVIPTPDEQAKIARALGASVQAIWPVAGPRERENRR